MNRLSPLLSVLLVIVPCYAGEVDEMDEIDALVKEEQEDTERLSLSLFVEAEEMSKEEGSWIVPGRVPHYTSRRYIRRQKLSPLTRRILIPSGGSYAVWVRYRVQSGKTAPFVLRIKSRGKEVLRDKFYNIVLESGLISEMERKHNLWFDLPGMQEGVFSGTEWCWQRAEADIPEGEALLSIEPLPSANRLRIHHRKQII